MDVSMSKGKTDAKARDAGPAAIGGNQMPWMGDTDMLARQTRSQCLHNALQMFTPGTAKQDRVIEAAKAFEAYINGDVPTPEAPAA